MNQKQPSEAENITESRLQADCFTWHWNNYPSERGQLFMVYNSPKSASHGAILKAMGMIAGVSDLIYLTCDSGIAFLECKLPNGIQGSKQKDFERMVLKLGHPYYIFRTIAEFKAIMVNLHTSLQVSAPQI